VNDNLTNVTEQKERDMDIAVTVYGTADDFENSTVISPPVVPAIGDELAIMIDGEVMNIKVCERVISQGALNSVWYVHLFAERIFEE